MDFTELYAPYSGMVPLEGTIGWLRREAIKLGISEEVLNNGINDTFVEMSNGKTFPLDGGDTGFDNIPHAALNHYMLSKIILFHKTATDAYNKANQELITTRLNTIVKIENDKFFSEVDKPIRRFLDLNNSYLVRGIAACLRRLYGLFRRS